MSTVSVLCVYKSGKSHWVDPANEKLRGVKIMGERPSVIYMRNPTAALLESGQLAMHPTYGKLEVHYD